MGFIEETGAAQFLRDVRVTAIYEGTNGIQAMDLVARKMADEGEAAFRLMEEVEATAEAARAVLPDLAHATCAAAETLREATEVLLAQPMETRFAGAVPYLRAFALVLGAHAHLRAALAEQAEAAAPGPRSRLARVFIARILPQHGALLAEMREGGGGAGGAEPGRSRAVSAAESAAESAGIRYPFPLAPGRGGGDPHRGGRAVVSPAAADGARTTSISMRWKRRTAGR